MVGTSDLETYLQTGIHAAQTTPLISRSGHLLGMISTHWREPHEPPEAKLRLLDLLARQAADFIERAHAEAALRQSEEQLRFATEAADIGLWDVDPVKDKLFWPPRVKAMFGISADAPVSMADFYAGLHSEDRERTSAAFADAVDPQKRTFYDVEYRAVGKDDGVTRWVAAKGRGVFDNDTCVRVIGTAIDITARKQAELHQQLLVNELNHRVKNTLATVQAIAAQTFRGTETDPTLREAFEARLIALSNAHSILTKSNWEGAEIGDVVQRSVEPHAGPERIQVHGPSIWLSPKAALAIALGMHELATNAAKYGALSNGTGQVAVTWSVDGPQPGTLNLQWAESGGPPVKKPTRKGFGSRLIERNLAHDLDGPSRIDYRPEGVICTITSPLGSAGGANMIGVLCKDLRLAHEHVSRKVLIIEDEGMVATLLEDMLSDLGHEVVGIAGRMVRAAELISETSADVVILDVNLNGEQTYSLASTLASRGIPFIFATGYGSAGLKDEWRSALTLQKPFQARDLEQAMRQVFNGVAA